ncbi:MAG TPA: DUF2867 domain-containing protein [Solirubrobacteraceae bacterium]|nr:DUF2867 domain-containing protein [Solirubrobacteraceae bacterium]
MSSDSNTGPGEGGEGGVQILLTGASGYVGGHLLRRLEQSHHRVRCLTRRPANLGLPRVPTTEVIGADLSAPETLGPAMKGVHTAYYLVHSMQAAAGFEELDRRAAANFARGAREAGLRHIIYLSGLGSGADLSAHLSSRHEVGEILRRSGVVTTELRASIVIGAGSASFEAVRALVEHLPAIPAPRVVDTAAQPIAIEDLIEYLIGALAVPAHSAIFEIGGRDQVTYADVMREYARQRNLRRRVVHLPARALRTAPTVLGVLIPTYGRVAAAMVDSLRNETVVRTGAAGSTFPVKPRGLSEAIEHAITSEDHEFADTSWGDVLPPARSARWGGVPVSRRLVSSRVLDVHADPVEVFAPIQRIGGATGWYAADWFWHLRGAVDRLRGGHGMRRGRRDPFELRVGDTIDFWRVERVQPGRRLLLTAEMKMPGRLWLQFEIAGANRRTELRQTTIFDPAGYAGVAYWYLLYPVHSAIFSAMLRGLRRESEPKRGCRAPAPDAVTGADHYAAS